MRSTSRLTPFEKRLLNRVQQGLPIQSRPFRSIARELGASEERVLKGLENLKRKGIVRRIGGVFSSRDLGFVSTLAAARVAPTRLRDVVKAVNAFQEVTHNYLRENDLNLWFTLTAPDRRRIRQILRQIARQSGVEFVRELPALKHYKVEVKFNL